MGVAVPIQRINQLIAEFLIKGFNGNSGLTQGGDLGKRLSLQSEDEWYSGSAFDTAYGNRC